MIFIESPVGRPDQGCIGGNRREWGWHRSLLAVDGGIAQARLAAFGLRQPLKKARARMTGRCPLRFAVVRFPEGVPSPCQPIGPPDKVRRRLQRILAEARRAAQVLSRKIPQAVAPRSKCDNRATTCGASGNLYGKYHPYRSACPSCIAGANLNLLVQARQRRGPRLSVREGVDRLCRHFSVPFVS
jgi:hypothetical protein